MEYTYTDKQLNELNHGKNVYSVIRKRRIA